MNQHDILTGSGLDGRALPAMPDRTCADWTSNADTNVTAQVGHVDRGGGGTNPMSWNSAHATPGCTQQQIISVGGAGRLYCFATNYSRALVGEPGGCV